WGLLLLSAALRATAAAHCPAPCVCDNLRAHVLCLNGSLMAIPDNIPELTKKLDLRGNIFMVIPAGVFLAIPYVTHLDLQHCKMERLEEGAFQGLGRLVYLNLASNGIAFLYQESLDGLSSLQHLILEGNRIEEIQSGAFGHLGSLTVLDLRANALVYLPDMVFQGLHVLRWLRLCSHLQPRPSPTAPPEQPRVAGSRQCPQGCVCSSDFHHGSCENRDLQEIPRDFPKDTRLLDLRRNPFMTVPPYAFPGLKELVSLHLQRCSIRMLHPGALRGLESLVYLYLSNNHLSTLAASAFEGVPQLAYLDLDHNAFTRVPAGAFRLLPNLISLHLQHNAIGELAEGDLAGARGLRWLYLAGNAIRHIASAALAPTKMLEKLHLEGNHLSEVPTAALWGLPALSELKLSRNPIKHMGDSVFLPVASSLQHLYLDNLGLERVS
ncbi:CHADL protein, partial [Chaetops frenatus]|nr:CHADL protein [Chaetops frenatus]